MVKFKKSTRHSEFNSESINQKERVLTADERRWTRINKGEQAVRLIGY
jgi:hypothetical protein